MPHSAHICAVEVVNHPWKAIKEAHILCENLIEATKCHGCAEYFPPLELNHQPEELRTLACSPQPTFNKTEAEHPHLLLSLTHSRALSGKTRMVSAMLTLLWLYAYHSTWATWDSSSSAASCRWPCFGRGLDQMTHRGPFQTLPFCNSNHHQLLEKLTMKTWKRRFLDVNISPCNLFPSYFPLLHCTLPIIHQYQSFKIIMELWYNFISKIQPPTNLNYSM